VTVRGLAAAMVALVAVAAVAVVMMTGFESGIEEADSRPRVPELSESATQAEDGAPVTRDGYSAPGQVEVTIEPQTEPASPDEPVLPPRIEVRTKTLHGTVIGLMSRAIAEATVTARVSNRETGQLMRSETATTGAAGSYSLGFQTSEGCDVELVAEAFGHFPRSDTFRSEDLPTSRHAVIQLEPRRVARIKGQLVDPDGRPLAPSRLTGLSVRAMLAEGDEQHQALGTIDPTNGAFVLTAPEGFRGLVQARREADGATLASVEWRHGEGAIELVVGRD